MRNGIRYASRHSGACTRPGSDTVATSVPSRSTSSSPIRPGSNGSGFAAATAAGDWPGRAFNGSSLPRSLRRQVACQVVDIGLAERGRHRLHDRVVALARAELVDFTDDEFRRLAADDRVAGQRLLAGRTVAADAAPGVVGRGTGGGVAGLKRSVNEPGKGEKQGY